MNRCIFITFLILINFEIFGQTNSNKVLDPYSILSKVISYSNSKYFNGDCKVGSVEGRSLFDFSKFSKQFPNVIVTYSVFLGSVRQYTELGVLRNFRFDNTGNFNTKILLADWQNLDKNSGSGTFELSLLDENYSNGIFMEIQGSSWRYSTIFKLNPEYFQEMVNLMTYNGSPRNFKRENEIKDSIIERENEIKKREKEKADYIIALRNLKEETDKRISDSIKQKVAEEKNIQEIENQIELEKYKILFDSMYNSFLLNGQVGDVLTIPEFNQNTNSEIIIVSKDNSGHGLIALRNYFESLSTWKNPKSIHDFNWRQPKLSEIVILRKAFKNKSFKKNFMPSNMQTLLVAGYYKAVDERNNISHVDFWPSGQTTHTPRDCENYKHKLCDGNAKTFYISEF